MIRKVVTVVLLVPLAVILIGLAVANRQTVTVSFDPFDAANPAYAASLPLFVLILILVIFGVILGGVAAWLRQARWRWAARRAEKENQELRLELDRRQHNLSPHPSGRLSPPLPGTSPPLRSPAE
jgi:uncharacterized integral membrane protein